MKNNRKKRKLAKMLRRDFSSGRRLDVTVGYAYDLLLCGKQFGSRGIWGYYQRRLVRWHFHSCDVCQAIWLAHQKKAFS